jgi:hypothetical protein
MSRDNISIVPEGTQIAQAGYIIETNVCCCTFGEQSAMDLPLTLPFTASCRRPPSSLTGDFVRTCAPRVYGAVTRKGGHVREGSFASI